MPILAHGQSLLVRGVAIEASSLRGTSIDVDRRMVDNNAANLAGLEGAVIDWNAGESSPRFIWSVGEGESSQMDCSSACSTVTAPIAGAAR
jgi:hypothetical protein